MTTSSVAAPALKISNWRAGDSDEIFQFSQEVYPTNFMSFFSDNFCRLLESGLGGGSPVLCTVPPRGFGGPGTKHVK